MNTTNTITESKVLVSSENHIKTITINNPKAKNAVSNEMTRSILEHIGKSRLDGTKVIILTGAEGNFCSGADLAAEGGMMNPKEYDVATYLRTGINAVVLSIQKSEIPVLAKVRGVAAGVGANFAMACDMIFAHETAMFSQIFTNIGLSSDGGGAYFMTKAMGPKKAFELMATAAKISAQEAEKLNMINQVLPDHELDAKVQEMAERLANGPTLAVKATKANIREAQNGNLESTLELETIHQAKNFLSEDFIEGVMAFLQKRKPNFKGK